MHLLHRFGNVFEGPGRVDDGRNLRALEEIENGRNFTRDVVVLTLLEQQVTQVEAADGLVVVVQLDRIDPVDLPPGLGEREEVLGFARHEERSTVEHVATHRLQKSVALRIVPTRVSWVRFNDSAGKGYEVRRTVDIVLYLVDIVAAGTVENKIDAVFGDLLHLAN